MDADLNSPLVLAVESHQKEAAHTLMQMGATLHGNVQKAAHKGIVANRIANRLRQLATRNDQRKFIGYLAAGANPNHLSGGAGSLESHAQSKATARGRFDAAGGHSGGQREVHTLHTVWRERRRCGSAPSSAGATCTAGRQGTDAVHRHRDGRGRRGGEAAEGTRSWCRTRSRLGDEALPSGSLPT